MAPKEMKPRSFENWSTATCPSGKRGDAGVLLRADEEVAFERAGKVGSGNGLPRSEGVQAALTGFHEEQAGP